MFVQVVVFSIVHLSQHHAIDSIVDAVVLRQHHASLFRTLLVRLNYFYQRNGHQAQIQFRPKYVVYKLVLWHFTSCTVDRCYGSANKVRA